MMSFYYVQHVNNHFKLTMERFPSFRQYMLADRRRAVLLPHEVLIARCYSHLLFVNNNLLVLCLQILSSHMAICPNDNISHC